MWTLAAADLGERLRSLLAWALGLVAGWIGMEMVTAGPPRWAAWFATAMVLVPVYSTLQHAAVESREQRAVLVELLPLDRAEAGLVRFASPLIVQLSGGVLSGGILLAAYLVTGRLEGSAGRLVVMTAALAALGQWVLLQAGILGGTAGAGRGTRVALSGASALAAAGLFVLLLRGLLWAIPAMGAAPASVIASAVVSLALLQINVRLHLLRGGLAG